MAWDAVWEVKENKEVKSLVDELDLNPLVINLLYNRGLKTPQQIEEFLDLSLDKLHNPYLISGMDEAVARIKKAITNKEKVVIYGDYDADGITSTAILMLQLAKLGLEVDYYIPNRLEEGYGLNKTALEKIVTKKAADLIITVDCGIKAYHELQYLKEKDVDLIITDHHTPGEKELAATAVINPGEKDCQYPFKYLAGVGIAFKLIMALTESNPKSDLKELLPLVTIGTIADIVPLLGENRVITANGLKYLNDLEKYEIKNHGLNALLSITGYQNKNISAGVVGYNIAPRINAAGRMGQAHLGVELFLAKTASKAEEIANELNRLNSKRQNISEEIFTAAEKKIKRRDLTEEWVLVVAGSHWHSGVIGNVASDLNEKYHRPVVLLSIKDGEATGSARSIKNYNIYDALNDSSDLLTAFGGHSQAAGLTIDADKIAQLRNNLNHFAQQNLTFYDLSPKLKIDNNLKLANLNMNLIKELEMLKPFGCRNPGPKFLLEKTKVKDFKQVGKSGAHLKLRVQEGQKVVDAIAFGMGKQAEILRRENEVSLVFTPEINSWQGRKKLQLKVRDIKFNKLDLTKLLIRRKETILSKEAEFNSIVSKVAKNDSDFELDNLKFIDKRAKIKKDRIIEKLANEKQRGLIYVNSRKKSIELIEKLIRNKIFKTKTIFYDTGLNLQERVRILTTFKRGDYNWLIINSSFDYRLKEAEFDSLIFYTPPFSNREFKKLLDLSNYNQIEDYYLLYNRHDLKVTANLLEELFPSRDLLAEFYILLYQLQDKGVIDKTKRELLAIFKKEFEFEVSIEVISYVIKVFSDLNILGYQQQGDIFQFSSAARGSLDLEDSSCYNKGVRFKKEFEKVAFMANLKTFIKSIK